VALPYFFTLLNGGRLGYLTRDKNSAGIVCPNSSAGVRYFASRDGAGVYRQRAFFSEADCPSEIRAGEEIIIKDFETGAPFYYSLSVLFCAMREARRHPEFFAGEDISVRFKLAGARLDWGVRF
jgi:hypothetical protein